MMTRKTLGQIIGLGLFLAVPVSALSAQTLAPSAVAGTWFNPRGSVAVRTGDCAGRLCGWVSWANQEALQDAKDSGVERLIGTELLQDYRSESPGNWRGAVFVPDMGHSFSSRITQVSPNELKISGCLIGGFICKSQIWHKAA